MELITKQGVALSLPKGYKQTEVGFIPEDWEVKKLGQIANIIGGGTPKTVVAKYWNGKINWFTPTEVGKQKYLVASKRKITLEGLQNSSAQILPVGTILLTSRAGIGDLGILTKAAATNQGFQSLTAFDDYDNEYVYYLLSILKPKLLSRASGSTFLEISPGKVKEISTGLPSTLTEQKSIATALSDVDALIASLEQTLTKKKAIKQGAMQQLLTPPHKGGKRLPGFSEDWKEKNIEELSKTFTKQTGFDYTNHIKPTLIKNKQRDHLPFIQNKDFEGHLVNFDTDYYIPQDVAVRFPMILLNEKCLMISISGSIGKVGVFNNKQMAFIGGAVSVGKFYNPLYLDWVMNYLQSEAGQNMMLKDVKAGSHQNLILDDIRKMVIPMPSLKEQFAVNQILSDMDAEITQLETKKVKYQAIKQGMMQELLTGKTRLI